MDEQLVTDMLNRCTVARMIGIEIYEVGEGRAKGRLKLEQRHLNLYGMPHGGIIFTLADQVAAACGNTLGKKAVAVEANMQYLKSVPGAVMLLAEAVLVHASRSLGRADVRVTTEGGETIATLHQLFFIKDEPHEGPASPDL
jgi:acyl-CoA thioesterase